MNKGKAYFESPYIYEVELDTSHPKYKKYPYLIIYKGKPMQISNSIVQFYSTEKLTLQEVNSMFAGTSAFKVIRGLFKESELI
jgi:hypothetical protein